MVVSLRLYRLTLLWKSHIPHSFYMSPPSHTPWFDYPNNIRWAVQIMKLSIKTFSPLSSYLFLLRANILLRTLFSNTLNTRIPLPLEWETKFHTYTRQQVDQELPYYIWILQGLNRSCDVDELDIGRLLLSTGRENTKLQAANLMPQIQSFLCLFSLQFSITKYGIVVNCLKGAPYALPNFGP
jgi:hypothetical protein